MDVLVSQFRRRMTNISLDLVRECINEVAWDERLSAIIGPRGVGKTTLILQYIGTARETFVVNQLGYQHRIEYGKKNGDFKIDGKYVFEVGGATKNFDQVANITDSYILADDIEWPVGNKLPVWLAGLLY